VRAKLARNQVGGHDLAMRGGQGQASQRQRQAAAAYVAARRAHSLLAALETERGQLLDQPVVHTGEPVLAVGWIHAPTRGACTRAIFLAAASFLRSFERVLRPGAAIEAVVRGLVLTAASTGAGSEATRTASSGTTGWAA